MQVIDIATPQSPQIIGSVNTPDYNPQRPVGYLPPGVLDVAVSGHHAYLAGGEEGLQVIDITDPTSPRFVGSANTPGIALGVAVSGHHAFIADYYSGLRVFDVSNPQNPEFAGNVDTPGTAHAVAISGVYAYIADGGAGLQVVDISNPRSPKRVGGLTMTRASAVDVVVVGDHAFVANGITGILVVDITNPSLPRLVASLDTPGEARDLFVSGSYAFVAAGNSGLQVIEIANPTHPRLMSGWDSFGEALGVFATGTHAYVTGPDGMQVVGFSTPEYLHPVGGVDTPGEARDVALSGAFAYVADGELGLQVIDITSPGSPQIVGNVDTPSDAYAVAVSGAHAYVTDYSGLWVIDATNATEPQLVASLVTTGHIVDVAVAGNFAYIGCYESRDRGDDESYAYGSFQVIDVTSPHSPPLAGRVDTPGPALRVAVSGTYAYVVIDVDDDRSLCVIDITNPVDPRIVASMVMQQSNARDIVISGTHAYVTNNGLMVIDIVDPSHPRLVAGLRTPESDTVKIAVGGAHAYITSWAGLHVIDITDPNNPQLVNTMEMTAEPNGVALSETQVYIASGGAGLQIAPLQCSARAPIATAGGPYTGECHVPIAFDASGSQAPDGRIVTYEWDWDANGVFDESTPVPTTTHTYDAPWAGTVLLRVTDDQSPPMASMSDAAVTVSDTRAPQIVSAVVLSGTEWRKRLQRVAIQLGVDTVDLCDPHPACRITGVSGGRSAPGQGEHDVGSDWEITGALSLELPIDFSLGSTGSAYRVTLASFDATENVAVAEVQLRVSFDRGRPAVRLEALNSTVAPAIDPDRKRGDTAASVTGDAATNTSSLTGATLALGIVRLFPNPVLSAAAVQFFLPTAAQVRLAIYDVRGRRVRQVTQGGFEPGLHSASWEARADGGAAFSQGIYFARLDVNGQQFIRRFAVVR